MDLWLLMGSGDRAQYWCKQCRVLTSSMDMEWYERLGADPEPLWVLDDGRVAFWMRSRHKTDGILRMYDPRTQTCTRLAYCLKLGASVYTGNLLRQQVQYAHGMEEL
nr:unnamed protein product [Digitaria exilis]